ncbi:Protein of unknown function [Actinokineospora alba]|uniref:DUF998 domain-containing protein n=1 Tax=Actinokineospora alba TaxID=504798 RepID=A0A1H0LKJ1_9PSEU|nr:DUF998 domain-containing protein [Actinokineospora alba]SDI98818.1 Protein of unknown function [Actinokineospora alba]SDO68722.1 Protein of unknown function [Actinokineospora alba]
MAGVFYLVTGVALGATRPGFDFGRHALSLLMLGDLGWAQAVNLVLSGVMTLAAAFGARRAMRGSRGATAASTLVGIFGVCLVASAIFPPDPMAGFPGGSTSTEVSVSGLLHMAFGAIGFLCLAAAAFVVAGWFARRGERRRALCSRGSGIVVAIGFVAGAAFSAGTLGVVFLWVAVVACWAWLAGTSLALYGTVPHPDAHRRNGSDTAVAPS